MAHDKVLFCSLGYGGNSMEYGGGCHGSWYLHTPAEIAEHYRNGLSEGVLCLDKRPAIDVNTAYAFASPMVNVEMQRGDVDRFQDRQTDFTRSVMIPALKLSGYGGVLAAAEIAEQVAPQEPGPLDYVDIDTYVEWWVARGALLFRYNGSEFVPV